MITRPFVRMLMAWLSVALAALLVAPSVASAAWAMSGSTSQRLSVGLRASNNLSKVKRFVIHWRAKCTSGATLRDTTVVGPVVIRPFPKFHAADSYMTSDQTNGHTFRVAVSAHLHGRLLLNIRARGTWSVRALVRDASGNQIDSCSTGLVRWAVHG